MGYGVCDPDDRTSLESRLLFRNNIFWEEISRQTRRSLIKNLEFHQYSRPPVKHHWSYDHLQVLAADKRRVSVATYNTGTICDQITVTFIIVESENHGDSTVYKERSNS